ncbi:MAG: hypothetical protein K6F75_04835 [Butyrivibrio sp.]|nr:hypothetical protein [Butyrivibrio sp.]
MDSKESFINKLGEIEQGARHDGIICLVMNSEIREINAETSEELDTMFEVNLSTVEMQAILKRVFLNWAIIKEGVVNQAYEIPRKGVKSRLTTSVITYVARKGYDERQLK